MCYEFMSEKLSAAHFRQMAMNEATAHMSTKEGAASGEGEEVLNELRLAGRKR